MLKICSIGFGRVILGLGSLGAGMEEQEIADHIESVHDALTQCALSLGRRRARRLVYLSLLAR